MTTDTPTYIRACPNCGARMEVFYYENRFHQLQEGARCLGDPAHEWNAETLVAMSRKTAVLGGI